MISNQNILDGLNHVEPYQSYTSSEDDSSELQSQLVGFNQQHLQLRRGMTPTRTIVDDHHLKLIRRKKEIPNPDVTQKKSNVTISSTSKTVDTKAIKQQSLLAVELPKDKAPQNPNVKLLKQSAPNPANSPVPKVQTPITYLSQKESVKINPTYINNNKQTINNNEVNNIKLTKVNNEFTIPPKQKSTGSTTYLSQKENVQINPTYIANSKQTINNKEVNNIKVTNVNNNVIYKPQFTNFGSLSDARNLPSFKNGFIPVNGRFLPASAFNTGRFTTYTTSRSTEFNIASMGGTDLFFRLGKFPAALFNPASFIACDNQKLIPTFNGFIDRFISGGDGEDHFKPCSGIVLVKYLS
ncbi:hypothetical protein PPACK8108_LOCUS25114 [Phakopsora pachyrhizi]|uniref:Uncharacterized protein n=1 Tax=Phakopsora pachyrhizi TaxID=170000 RepID=A0AAV0BS30_PHAPC|nr:hypothetical protein PPACK8108_LOCUS25114 [Phakopsora pachyrhizi]